MGVAPSQAERAEESRESCRPVSTAGVQVRVDKQEYIGLRWAASYWKALHKEAVERGQVLAQPGSITPHTRFKAEAYILTKNEGGRHTPFFTNYRPQFYFRTTDVTGMVHLPEVREKRRVARGIVKVGDEVEIVGIKETTKTVCTGVEMFRKLLDQGEAGDNIGALLRGTKREDVERGQVLSKPGAITPHTKFKAEAYILTKAEGGRHTPFFSNYRPQFYFRTTDVTGMVELPDGSSRRTARSRLTPSSRPRPIS